MTLVRGGVAFVIIWAASAAAEPAALTGEAVRASISGRTVQLETPYGGLPITYRSDGTMSAQAGALASYVGSANDKGTWWISRDQLCQRWSTWLDGKAYCFTLRREGRTFHWTSNDGRTGVARLTN